MTELARAAAVAAEVLAEHGDALTVWAVDVRGGTGNFLTGAHVSLQIGYRPTGEAVLEAVARAALVLGFDHVQLHPVNGHVRVVAVGEVSTSAGTARVEAWDHLTGGDIERAAELLKIGLHRDTDPVYVATVDLLGVLAAVA
ncbi:hypothetical protein ACFV4N_08375 [Actinosynnema sp. NPDC059797]